MYRPYYQAVNPRLGVSVLVTVRDADLGTLGHDAQHIWHHRGVDLGLGARQVDHDGAGPLGGQWQLHCSGTSKSGELYFAHVFTSNRSSPHDMTCTTHLAMYCRSGENLLKRREGAGGHEGGAEGKMDGERARAGHFGKSALSAGTHPQVRTRMSLSELVPHIWPPYHACSPRPVCAYNSVWPYAESYSNTKCGCVPRWGSCAAFSQMPRNIATRQNKERNTRGIGRNVLSAAAAAQGTKCSDEVADALAASVMHRPYSPIASTPAIGAAGPLKNVRVACSREKRN